ncbi:alpha/beta fold hydrolase [Streptomyces sp. Li-HN-5-11]|uniref:thioesterase II family protein n=1 Tax=Streptomyces sp. Li-HN-5-11 TaxID=3075432 RepID=UPI0028A85479|nr:alpha/beta fold hydrolase [Streptomyces sp. Li-HN-5-11]WNM30388.1 alpha/beta fold hydrolase [Streptomyces sp. Li-HN-5-11]
MSTMTRSDLGPEGRTLPKSLVAFDSGPADGPALVCIPWAGAGGAPFQAWAPVLDGTAAVHAVRLPGRESRIDEPLLNELEPIVEEVVRGVRALGDRPVALFGLCSGALVAFEAARALGPGRVSLLAASQMPPAVAARVATEELASREGLAARYLPAELLAEPEMVELLIEVLEADIQAVSGYRHAPEPLDGVPVTVFRGAQDPEIGLAEMDGWHAETTGPVHILEVPGADHLFTGAAWRGLAEQIGVRLRGALTMESSGVE